MTTRTPFKQDGRLLGAVRAGSRWHEMAQLHGMGDSRLPGLPQFGKLACVVTEPSPASRWGADTAALTPRPAWGLEVRESGPGVHGSAAVWASPPSPRACSSAALAEPLSLKPACAPHRTLLRAAHLLMSQLPGPQAPLAYATHRDGHALSRGGCPVSISRCPCTAPLASLHPTGVLSSHSACL